MVVVVVVVVRRRCSGPTRAIVHVVWLPSRWDHGMGEGGRGPIAEQGGGWVAREGVSKGEGREREKTGVGMMGKARSPRGSRRGWGCVSSDGRSAVVPLSAWHRRCCVVVVGWTHECMSTRVHTDITACMHTRAGAHAGVVG